MTEKRRTGAESSRKVLALLQRFDEQRHTRTAQELAEDTGLPLSTAYRYLTVLRDAGLVQEAARGEYRLSPRLVALGRAARAADGGLVGAAQPVLARIARESGETALLIKRSGWSAVCVDRVESGHPVRLQFDPGQPMALHAGSAARVLLAAMANRERERYADSLLAKPNGERLELPRQEELAAVGRSGWAQSFGEVDEGIWGASAAVRESGETVAALGVAGPLFRLNQSARDEIVELVRAGARDLSAALDGLEADFPARRDRQP